MNSAIKKVIISLLVLAISTGAAAVVKVYILEFKFLTLEEKLEAINKDTKAIRCKLGDSFSCVDKK